jgi:hypothetical protein
MKHNPIPVHDDGPPSVPLLCVGYTAIISEPARLSKVCTYRHYRFAALKYTGKLKTVFEFGDDQID